MLEFYVKTYTGNQFTSNIWSKHRIQFENSFANFYGQFGRIKGSN